MKRLLLIVILSTSLPSLADNYYVSVTGDDANSGLTLDAPLKTIQKAADLTQPGDVVLIRASVYREEVSIPRSGAAGSPITFQAYNGEKVVVTTTDILQGWVNHWNSIYKTALDTVSAIGRYGMIVFVNDVLMQEAAWSDKDKKPDYLRSNTFANNNSGTLNTLQDNDLRGMSNTEWSGAYAWVQSSNWSLTSHVISGFDGASGTITLATNASYVIPAGKAYLIYNSIKALDAEGEWYFEEPRNLFYLWAPGGGNPASDVVEVRRRAEAFKLNGNSYLTFKNLELKGGDLAMAGSGNILVQGCHIRVPTRSFGPVPGKSSDGLTLSGDNNIIRDNDFAGGWDIAVRLQGANNSIVNNHFHNLGQGNANGAAISLGKTKTGNLISHNTFNHIGRSSISGSGGKRIVIQYNEFYDCAILTFDVGGGVYFAGTDLGNSIFHHNVFHDIMGELSTGFYLDNMCSNVVYHHNISYNTSYTGFTLGPPCAFVLVFNNTCYNKGNAFGFNRENNTCAGVRFYNNIFSEIHPDFEDGGAIVTPNLITTATSHWVNAASNDFRLRSGSAAVNIGTMIPFITDNVSDGRPDAGALELGETIWEYGHNFTTPPNPTYDWFLVSFLNVVENPSFETGLAPWTIVTGTPSIINGNSWNYKDDALAIAGSNALELKPGDKVQQKLSGLMKNTTYMFKFSARLVKDLQIEKYDAKSSSGTQGYYRAEDCMQNLRSGDWFQFNQFDFGTSSRFNRVEIGNCLVPSMSVEVRLDSPTGTLVASIPLESGDRWYATGTSIQSVTGVHNVYLVIKSNMATGYLDRIRFLNTANTEKVTFGVSDFDPAQGPKSENTGGSAWQNGSIMFKTGPASTSATLFIEKSGGELNGYVDQTRVSTESVTSIAPNAESVRNTVLYRIHSKYLHVFGLDRQGNNQISLISLNGRMVKKVTVSEKSECILGLQGISQGIYFLQVVSRDRNFRERIIITR